MKKTISQEVKTLLEVNDDTLRLIIRDGKIVLDFAYLERSISGLSKQQIFHRVCRLVDRNKVYINEDDYEIEER